ncbi:unnamed protein product [marine sediment metagenome]|uniref:Uncharacterized protein n=1 Tax=marine sediment metagenome TaxID=412755 RepID=X1PUZ1_9ZZZZ
MAIQDELATIIRKARYLPELLPLFHTQDLATGDNPIITLGSPTISPAIPILTDKLSATPDATVLLKLKADKLTHKAETISLDVMGELTPLEFLATSSLSLVLNADAPVSDYKMYLGIWVVRPSIAQRILWGLPLTAQHEELSRKRGVRDSVVKGILPFPTSYQIERECMGFKRTYAEVVANVTSGQATQILVLSLPESSAEFLVLESVTADNAGLTLANNAQIFVTRDDDMNYLKLPVFPMDSAYDFPAFIPALRKLEISYYADATLTNRYVRFTIARYKLTDILSARFNLEATPEARESTLCGVVP